MMEFILIMLLMLILGSNMYMYMYMMIVLMIMCMMYMDNMGVMLVSMYMYMDLISFLLVFLSIWVMILMRLSMKNYNVWWFKSYNIIELSMLIFLFLSFSMYNLMGFYIFFESVLIPIILMIYMWGGNSERFQAGMYMLMYTLFGSLPLLLMLLKYSVNSSLMYMYMYMDNFTFMSNMEVLFIMLAFLVKLPMFMMHLWLPKAHVEAPVAGSMILAGVLLKLGGYGLYRVMIIIYMKLIKMNFFFMSMVLIGGVYISMLCLVQIDVKVLIAYSSVAHMSLVLGGLLSDNYFGMSGMCIMMIAHGLCSSGLFYLVNIYYDRIGSRSMILMKGLGYYYMGIMWMMFIMCGLNLGLPLSLNYLSEVMLMVSIVKFNMINMILLIMLSFLVACYSLYMFIMIFHGKSWMLFSNVSIKKREYMITISHLIPLVLMLMKGDMFML